MDSLQVRFHCSADQSTRTATFSQVDEEYQIVAVSSAPAAPSHAAWSGDELPVNGSFGTSPTYAGCPGCGSDGFVCCGSCGDLSCWRTGGEQFTCGRCGNVGPVSGGITSIRALATTPITELGGGRPELSA
ncbi:hypothetical protein [Dactylosporangium matsuzakiense]|uniref:hypothetical protein n=1 Tax=Dactylosporangium matsuzakiense TaxID=53360 RepID=UPI0021C35B09|nr:hypothetical protein [Dactylosporangium matsuzakiense]UWZ47836.1 hypothetical protein Dmats_16380 [Dactylosporangium matsuzakiense]